MGHYPDRMRAWAKSRRDVGQVLAAVDLERSAARMEKLIDNIRVARGALVALSKAPVHPKTGDWPVDNPIDAKLLQAAFDALDLENTE